MQRGEGLVEVGDNVVDVFGANGEPHGRRRDGCLLQLGFRKLGMRGACWVYHQALHVCHVGEQAEEAQVVYELPSGLLSSADLKGEYRCATVREKPTVCVVVGMVRQARMVHALDLGPLREILLLPLRRFRRGAARAG